MPTNLPEDQALRQLEGYDTVPRDPPAQKFTLYFLAGLVTLTYSAFFVVMVLGVQF